MIEADLPAVRFFLIALSIAACLVADAASFGVLTREHVDGPKVIFMPGASNELTLVMRDEDARTNYTGTNVILVAKAESKLTLPSGTPFGNAGAPFWILPQSQNPNLLYLGISAENIPVSAFNGPFHLRITRFDGPGYFMVWQATAPGQFNIRIDTRDGVGNDGFTPPIGAHEHYNWGFSTTGVYCVTYQVSGVRSTTGQTISSPEMTVAYHVLPLPPATNYGTWQKHFWPPGFVPSITATNGNEDADAFSNLHEYAFGLSPTNLNAITNAPQLTFVETNGQRFGALTFNRNTAARDLMLEAQAASALSAAWVGLANPHAHSSLTAGVERATFLDSLPTSGAPTRFYRFQPRLLP